MRKGLEGISQLTGIWEIEIRIEARRLFRKTDIIVASTPFFSKYTQIRHSRGL